MRIPRLNSIAQVVQDRRIAMSSTATTFSGPDMQSHDTAPPIAIMDQLPSPPLSTTVSVEQFLRQGGHRLPKYTYKQRKRKHVDLDEPPPHPVHHENPADDTAMTHKPPRRPGPRRRLPRDSPEPIAARPRARQSRHIPPALKSVEPAPLPGTSVFYQHDPSLAKQHTSPKRRTPSPSHSLQPHRRAKRTTAKPKMDRSDPAFTPPLRMIPISDAMRSYAEFQRALHRWSHTRSCTLP